MKIIKKTNLIIALTVLLFASCKDKDNNMDDSSVTMDSVQKVETSIDTTMVMDSTMTTSSKDSSDVKLLDKIDETKKNS